VTTRNLLPLDRSSTWVAVTILTIGLVALIGLVVFQVRWILRSRFPGVRGVEAYFTVTVFSTVGFGDITAKTEAARLVVTGQMIVDLVASGSRSWSLWARSSEAARAAGRRLITPRFR